MRNLFSDSTFQDTLQEKSLMEYPSTTLSLFEGSPDPCQFVFEKTKRKPIIGDKRLGVKFDLKKLHLLAEKS